MDLDGGWVAFLVVMIVLVFVLTIALAIGNMERNFCSEHGYSKRVWRLGEMYCLHFDDGVLSRVAIRGEGDEYDEVTMLMENRKEE
jgi:hypothetical protein